MERCFSKVLAELRKRQGLSQRAAAADLQISQALLSHYENGAREPGLNFVCRACEYYGVTSDYLLGRSGEQVDLQIGGEQSQLVFSSLLELLEGIDSADLNKAAENYMIAAFSKLISCILQDDPKKARELDLVLALTELQMRKMASRHQLGELDIKPEARQAIGELCASIDALLD